MTPAEDLVPAPVLKFLEERGGSSIEFDRAKDPYLEVDSCVFHRPASLRESRFTISTDEYYQNYGEQGDDPKLVYEIPGVDLVAGCEAYGPQGLLVWFPTLGDFGFWDPDHGLIGLFPETTWEVIEKNLARYMNAQWNVPSKHALLRPWADERCAGISGKRI